MSDFHRVERVIVTHKSPWPERRGCYGWTLTPANPEAANRYPWRNKGSMEVLVLLDDDPLTTADQSHRDEWTFTTDGSCLEILNRPAGGRRKG